MTDHKSNLQSGAAAAGNGNQFQVKGKEAIAFQVDGISGDTITFEGTIDGAHWYAIRCRKEGSDTSGNTATADGIYHVQNANFLAVRARISTYSAGEITVQGLAR